MEIEGWGANVAANEWGEWFAVYRFDDVEEIVKVILRVGRLGWGVLVWQGRPNLENRIITLTLAQPLSCKRFSHFLRYLVAQRMGLLTMSFGAAQNALLEAAPSKGSIKGVFQTASPRKGTETFKHCEPPEQTSFQTASPRKGTETMDSSRSGDVIMKR
ncbi:MAG: hypothetical protein ACFB5Z_06675 [Elainellaceae cyanobacterium]